MYLKLPGKLQNTPKLDTLSEIPASNKDEYIQKTRHMGVDFVWKLTSSLWIHILEDSALKMEK